jgi:hypothetical protein
LEGFAARRRALSLTDDEANAAYDALASAAQEVHLDWIVREVEAEVTLGRVELRTLPVQDKDLFGSERIPSPRRRRSPGETRGPFNVSRPLTPQERLLLLAESLEAGVVELNEVAAEVLTFVEGELGQERVVFASDADVNPSFELAASDLRARRDATDRLSSLLQELKRELHDASPTSASY